MDANLAISNQNGPVRVLWLKTKLYTSYTSYAIVGCSNVKGFEATFSHAKAGVFTHISELYASDILTTVHT